MGEVTNITFSPFEERFLKISCVLPSGAWFAHHSGGGMLGQTKSTQGLHAYELLSLAVKMREEKNVFPSFFLAFLILRNFQNDFR